MGRGSVQPITSHQPGIICPCRGGAVETVTPDLWTWWVDQPLGSGAQIAGGNTVTEAEVDEHLTARRKAQPGFVDCSFPTIAGNIPPPFSTIAPRKRARLRGAAPGAALLTLAAVMAGCGGWRGGGRHGAALHHPCLHCASIIACRLPMGPPALPICQQDQYVAVGAARGGWRAAGEGPNGAVIHYRAAAPGCGTVTRDSHLLIDSGGQYDVGTTDVPPTLAGRLPLHDGRPPSSGRQPWSARGRPGSAV